MLWISYFSTNCSPTDFSFFFGFFFSLILLSYSSLHFFTDFSVFPVVSINFAIFRDIFYFKVWNWWFRILHFLSKIKLDTQKFQGKEGWETITMGIKGFHFWPFFRFFDFGLPSLSVSWHNNFTLFFVFNHMQKMVKTSDNGAIIDRKDSWWSWNFHSCFSQSSRNRPRKNYFLAREFQNTMKNSFRFHLPYDSFHLQIQYSDYLHGHWSIFSLEYFKRVCYIFPKNHHPINMSSPLHTKNIFSKTFSFL